MFRHSIYIRAVGSSLLLSLTAIPATTAELSDLHAQEVTHPIPEYVVRPLEPTATIAFGDTGDVPPDLRSVAQKLASAVPDVTIGVLEGNEEQIFGEIEDLAVGRDGRLYLLDSQAKRIIVFRPGGEFVQYVGGPGQGPGEFRRPLTVAVDDDGDLYVGDITRQIHVFESSTSGLSFRESLRLDVAPQHMCIMADRLIVQGSNPETTQVFHLYDKSGELLDSFGSVYDSEDLFANMQISEGRVLCQTAANMIVYAPTSLIAEVRGYTVDGTLKWLTAISGYKPVHYSTTAGGGHRVQIPQRGYHHVKALTALTPGHALLQIAFRSYESYMAEEEYAELHTFLLDSETGEAMYVGTNLDPILAVTDSFYVTVRQDPFPFVRIHSLDDPAEGH